MEEAIQTVLWTFKNAKGSEIVVPKLKSFKVLDLIHSINNKPKIKIIGIRPGEKIHEEMITTSDSQNTLEMKNIYIILPSDDKKFTLYYKRKFRASKVKKDFTYRSNSTKKFLSVKELKKIIEVYNEK